MKNAILPAVRVASSLRKNAEKLLRPDESLSGFVEEAVQRNIERRKADAEFLARGLTHRDEAARTDDYLTPDEMREHFSKTTAAPGARKRAR